jgi:hypothetical protein
MVQEIVAEMDYLRSREQKLRDTNESTNNRVKWFAFSTMGMLVALGAWQVIYLRAYFRYVWQAINLKMVETNLPPDQSILFKGFLEHCDSCVMISGLAGKVSGIGAACVIMVVENRYIMTQKSVRSKTLHKFTLKLSGNLKNKPWSDATQALLVLKKSDSLITSTLCIYCVISLC